MWKCKKSIIFICVMLIAMSMLCACGQDIPDMTEEEMALITDYASALLLKYDSNSPSRLLPEGSVDMSIVFIEPDTSPASPASSTESEKTENSEVPLDSSGFENYLTDTGLSIEYSGRYEVLDSYPEDNSNAYFAVDASAGHKLLVIHFTLKNISGSDLNVNLNSLDLRYRVSVNGSKNKNVMTTMLDNDILSFVGDLAADEERDIVAISEISEEETDINSLVFVIRGDKSSAKMTLQ